MQNHLEVVLPAGNYRDDALLTTTANSALTLNIAVPDGVEDALDRNALILDDSDVAAGTSGNTVTLTGHVRTWAAPTPPPCLRTPGHPGRYNDRETAPRHYREFRVE
jgi:osmotically-inducible protein OsmY